jgi:predicted ATPase
MDQHLIKPLSGLVQVFESLLSAIFSDPKQDHADWRAKILDVLQAQASVFLSLISPSWREVLLGTEEEMGADDFSETVTDIPEREIDWARYVSSFRTWAWSLLRLFSSPQRPLIIILDDVQWQEPAERELWIGLLHHESRHLVNAMVCFTYRTDTEPQLAFSSVIKIAIRPLSQASVQKLVAKALHVDGPLNSALTFVALFLHSTTSGNPFYCYNLLGALFRDDVLVR